MSIHNFLIEQGFRGPTKDNLRDYCVYFYRKIEGTKHQLVVEEYVLDLPNRPTYRSYEVKMVYECKDGIWVDSKFYGLNEEDIRTKLSDLEKRLLFSVVVMGGNPVDYEGKEDLT